MSLLKNFFSSGRANEESFLPQHGDDAAMDESGRPPRQPYRLSDELATILTRRDAFFVDLIKALNACDTPIHNDSGSSWVIDVETNKKLGDVKLLLSTSEARNKRPDDDATSSWSLKSGRHRNDRKEFIPLLPYNGAMIDVTEGSYTGYRFRFLATKHSIALSYDFEAFLEANPMVLPEGMSDAPARPPSNTNIAGKKTVGFAAGSGSVVE